MPSRWRVVLAKFMSTKLLYHQDAAHQHHGALEEKIKLDAQLDLAQLNGAVTTKWCGQLSQILNAKSKDAMKLLSTPVKTPGHSEVDVSYLMSIHAADASRSSRNSMVVEERSASIIPTFSKLTILGANLGSAATQPCRVSLVSSASPNWDMLIAANALRDANSQHAAQSSDHICPDQLGII